MLIMLKAAFTYLALNLALMFGLLPAAPADQAANAPAAVSAVACYSTPQNATRIIHISMRPPKYGPVQLASLDRRIERQVRLQVAQAQRQAGEVRLRALASLRLPPPPPPLPEAN